MAEVLTSSGLAAQAHPAARAARNIKEPTLVAYWPRCISFSPTRSARGLVRLRRRLFACSAVFFQGAGESRRMSTYTSLFAAEVLFRQFSFPGPKDSTDAVLGPISPI